ncbi:class I SAM-dependent methyltransferase [Blastococcus sp. SYSU D00669]
MVTPQLAVDPRNADQLRAWDGEEGSYWARHAGVFERSTARYDDALFAAAGIGPGERVLDIGCGTGSTTREAGRRAVSGAVLGVDLSSAMLAVARRAAADLPHVAFLQADAQVHPFDEGSFDVAVSRTGAMFFADPVAAFANIGRALRPGGRLVLLVWQAVARNEWFRALTGALAAGRDLPAPPGGLPPFSLADPARVRAVLSAAGFTGVGLTGIEEPEWLGPDAATATDFVLGLLGWLLDGLDADRRDRAVAALRATIEAHVGQDGVEFGSAAWLVTARRQGLPAVDGGATGS